MTAKDRTRVQNEQQEPTFYARIPKMCSLDLNPYELALYCNYKQTASDDGYCDKSNSKLAKETHMSVGKVKQAKKSLEDKKLITIEHRKDKSGIENQTTYIKIVDIWKQNHDRYAIKGSQDMTRGGHHMTTPWSPDNQGVVTTRPQIRTSEEKPLKNYRAPLLDPFFDAIAAVWETRATGFVNNMKAMMLGTSTDSEYAGSNFDPPANPQEILSFGQWYKRKNPELSIPRKPEKIQRWFYDFRVATAKKISTVDPAHDLSIPVDFEPVLLQYLPKAAGNE